MNAITKIAAPSISVLVTVYNREQYLEQTLRSILDSTFTDFELIVVDDASSDGSFELANEIAKRDARIKLYRNDQNLGDYGNRAKAVSLASGKYLKFVDSDDLIYPYGLEVMVVAMEQYPDAALGVSHSLPEDEQPYPWKLAPGEIYKKHYLGKGALGCGPTGAIFKKEAFETIGGFNAGWGVLSDTDLWLRMASKWPVILLPPALIWWRKHEEQEFRKDQAFLTYILRGFELDKKILTDGQTPLSPIDQQLALKKVTQHFARRLIALAVKQREFSAVFKGFRDAGLKITDLIKGLRPYI